MDAQVGCLYIFPSPIIHSTSQITSCIWRLKRVAEMSFTAELLDWAKEISDLLLSKFTLLFCFFHVLGELLSEHRVHYPVFRDWHSYFSFHCRGRNLLSGSGESPFLCSVVCDVKSWVSFYHVAEDIYVFMVFERLVRRTAGRRTSKAVIRDLCWLCFEWSRPFWELLFVAILCQFALRIFFSYGKELSHKYSSFLALPMFTIQMQGSRECC